MSRYKIMIVDDEAEVREGIVGHIDWTGLGFEVVAQAENGRDGLEKAESLDLDVVLTDIKMPYMDGLAMSAELIRTHPAVKLILFSGFDEFEYAKEAIRLNVVEYVLKPVNVEELTQILRRVKETLDAQIAEHRNIEALNAVYAKSLPLMRERFLSELLWGAIDPAEIDEQLKLHQIYVNEGKYKLVTVFDVVIRPEETLPIAREFAPLSVRQIAEENLRGKCRFAAIVGSASLILITAWEEEDCVSRLMNVVNETCAYCRHIYELELCAGIGRPRTAISELHGAYTEARAALEYRSFAGTGKAIYIQDVEQLSQSAAPATPDEQRMLTAIRFGTGEHIEAMVDGLLADLDAPGRNDWEVRGRLMGILSTVYQIVRRYGLLNEDAVVARMQESTDLLTPPLSLARVRAWLCDIAACIGGYIVERRESAARRLVQEAEQFIGENYANPRLSVERLCEHLHVSASYFSTIFKQETGQSYVQYLTGVRMRQALRLLQETDDKTYLIAGKTGYEDPNYFSYVFKRYFGASPSKFRS